MPTLDDLLSNRDAYPDGTTVRLADGVDTTLGDLRKNTMLERDYRQKTGRLADERRKFETQAAEWEGARIEAEAKLADLAKQLIHKNPEAGRDEVEDMLERDPIARKLNQKIGALETKLTERDSYIEQQQQRMQQYEQNYIADQHRRVLSYLKTQDPDLNESELVNFARANYIPRLDHAYNLMTKDRRESSLVEKTRKEAMEEGYAKAKTELLQPKISPRRTIAPSADAPKNLDEAAERALQDPEVIAAMQGT